MSRIALTQSDVRMKGFRRGYVPVITTILAMMVVLLPIVTTTPVIPDIGFLVLIAWRLLRPEMWTASMAVFLGLLNDLISGHPLGQSMALWPMMFLLLDFIESRAVFRDFWMDWLLASVLILLHSFGDWFIGRAMGNQAAFGVLWPQLAFSILAYPIVARLILALDRWRLTR